MKALITGISGFVGTYLTNYLVENGYEVFGTVKLNGKEKLPVVKKVNFFEGELLDKNFIDIVVKEVQPEVVFHLASFTSPKQSLDDPYNTLVNNVGITVNLLETLKNSNARILLIGSADEYGLIEQTEKLITEETPLRPTNPYAVSKIAQDYLGLQYALTHKMNIVRVRPGNHIGPGQRPDFVTSAFARQIALIEKGKQEPVIKVGNLDAERDFTDVRDIVRAYQLAALQGERGEVYNLGSGKGIKIRKILETLLSCSEIQPKIEEDQSRKLLFDNPKVVIDFSKFKELTGWEPEIQITQSLEEILNYWRQNV